MRINKAVITAAARGARLHPAGDTVQKAMLPVTDLDGVAKPVLQIICQEALTAGIDAICLVCAPGDEERYIAQFRRLQRNLHLAFADQEWAEAQAAQIDVLLGKLHFTVQEHALGYGDAVASAREWVADEAFLLLLSDHLYISHLAGKPCACQLVEAAIREGCAISAVNATREHLVGRFGTLTGKPEPERPGLYQVERIIEKPALSRAELELQTPGLRVGHYLCFFGMHVLTPTVFTLLAEDRDAVGVGELALTPALERLARHERYLALQIRGDRYDMGGAYGHLQAQLGLGLAGRDREEVLEAVVEAMAQDRSRDEREGVC